MSLRFRLDDLPDALRAQALRQLSPRTPPAPATAEPGKGEGKTQTRSLTPRGRKDAEPRPTPPACSLAPYPTPSSSVRPPSRDDRGVPNRTEADYNDTVLRGNGRYEAVTLRLPGGNYTPDWMTIDDGIPTFHECKGAYRFGSESRAILAFLSAAAAFPFFNFVWAQRQKGGKWVVKHAVPATPTPDAPPRPPPRPHSPTPTTRTPHPPTRRKETKHPMTCESCQFDPIVKALAAILKTYPVCSKSSDSSRRSSQTRELDPVEYKIARELSKRKPKEDVIRPLRRLHPKFRQLVRLVREIVESPDGFSPSFPQQVCHACSENSDDNNLSNSGQTFVSIDAMASSGIASPSDPRDSVDDDPSAYAYEEQPDPTDDPTADPDSPQPDDPMRPSLSQTAHDYLARNALPQPSRPSSPASNLPPDVQDTLVKHLNDFRSLPVYDQMLILQQWSGGTFSDFGSMKWMPDDFRRKQSKQRVSQRWRSLVQRFPLAAALKSSKALKPVNTQLSQHFADDSADQLDLPGL